MKIYKLITYTLGTFLLFAMQGCGSGNESSSQMSDQAVVSFRDVSSLKAKVFSDSVKLQWKENEKVDFYELIISKEGKEENFIELSSDTLEYVDFSIEKLTKYNYTLNGYDKNGVLISSQQVNTIINQFDSMNSDEAII